MVPDLIYDVVLGLPWLSEANPVIDCSRRILKFNINGELPIEELSSTLGFSNGGPGFWISAMSSKSI